MDRKPLESLAVGDRVFVFDANSRTYQPGGLSGAPIWRGHWRERYVIGRTAKAFVLGQQHDVGCQPKDFPRTGERLPLAGRPPATVMLSEAELDDATYVEEMRFRLRDALQRMELLPQNAPVVRRVEDALREAGVDIPARF